MFVELWRMRFLCLSIILALAVSLASAVSVSQLINDEWELFKVMNKYICNSYYLIHLFWGIENSQQVLLRIWR